MYLKFYTEKNASSKITLCDKPALYTRDYYVTITMDAFIQ